MHVHCVCISNFVWFCPFHSLTFSTSEGGQASRDHSRQGEYALEWEMVQAWDMSKLQYWNKLTFSSILEWLSQSMAVSACSVRSGTCSAHYSFNISWFDKMSDQLKFWSDMHNMTLIMEITSRSWLPSCLQFLLLTSQNNDISIKLEAGIADSYLCIHRTIVVGTISSCIVGEMNECAMSCNTAYRVYIVLWSIMHCFLTFVACITNVHLNKPYNCQSCSEIVTLQWK